MKIKDLLSPMAIALNSHPSSKEDLITELATLMARSGVLFDQRQYQADVWIREKEGTTGVGNGVAIPHAKSAAVKQAGLAVAVIPEGIDYDSLDQKPVDLAFMIAAPDTGADVHLQALAKLSAMLMDSSFKEELMTAKSPEAFIAMVNAKEELLDMENQEKTQVASDEGYQILAVTACPTGIAHTFMAAESLELKAKELGISIKVETQGADGAKNVLTPEDITKASAVIIAADKNVDLSRFDGKPVVLAKVADGIHKPEELIDEGLSGRLTPYRHLGGNQQEGSAMSGESVGRQIYKHLISC